MTRYSLKFASLLRILRLEADLDFANTSDTVDNDSYRSYRLAKIQYLKNALTDLRQEYDALYAAALPIAMKDRELGSLLAEAEKAFHKSVRQIKIAIIAARFVPSRTTNTSTIASKALAVLPRFDSPANLLALMEQVSAHLEHA
jgi:hypothetical protein